MLNLQNEKEQNSGIQTPPQSTQPTLKKKKTKPNEPSSQPPNINTNSENPEVTTQQVNLEDFRLFIEDVFSKYLIHIQSQNLVKSQNHPDKEINNLDSHVKILFRIPNFHLATHLMKDF
jgi:hypothetical protein